MKLLSPICPHITEEIWNNLGNKNFLSLDTWPEVDEKKINEQFEKEDKAIDDIINDVNNILRIVKEKGRSPVRLIYTLFQKKQTFETNAKTIEKRTGLSVKVFSVSDAKRHDPENKSKKANQKDQEYTWNKIKMLKEEDGSSKKISSIFAVVLFLVIIFSVLSVFS